MSEKKIKITLHNAVVDVKIGTGYISRLNSLLAFLIEGKSKEEIESAKEQISNNKITDNWVKHLETIYILIREFEQECDKNGFTKEMTDAELDQYKKDNQ